MASIFRRLRAVPGLRCRGMHTGIARCESASLASSGPAWSVKGDMAKQARMGGADLTREQIDHVAQLAHLDLEASPVAADRLVADVQMLMRAVARVTVFEAPPGLAEPAGVENAPMSGALLAHDAPEAEDAATEGGDAERVLANAQARDGPFFVVPRSLDD